MPYPVHYRSKLMHTWTVWTPTPRRCIHKTAPWRLAHFNRCPLTTSSLLSIFTPCWGICLPDSDSLAHPLTTSSFNHTHPYPSILRKRCFTEWKVLQLEWPLSFIDSAAHTHTHTSQIYSVSFLFASAAESRALIHIKNTSVETSTHISTCACFLLCISCKHVWLLSVTISLSFCWSPQPPSNRHP